MSKGYLLLIFAGFLIYISSGKPAGEGTKPVKFAFYNVENLFDTLNAPETKDEEFTPEGEKHWSGYRYYEKLAKTGKTIIALGKWNPPAVIGLAEIENRYVLKGLTKHSPLKKFGYKIIHQDSPDKRGIDCALLYLDKLFMPLSTRFIPVHNPGHPQSKTRDIVYVKGLLNNTDTLHVFVNHWPSRYGGKIQSEPKRVFVANLLKAKTDSILKHNQQADIIIMGDFNDQPADKSLTKGLNAVTAKNDTGKASLINLMALEKWQRGTLKFRGKWQIFDQFIVSKALLNGKNKLKISLNYAEIFSPDWLLEEDKSFMGKKPFRTYHGPQYHGGFSDHLPVYITLQQK